MSVVKEATYNCSYMESFERPVEEKRPFESPFGCSSVVFVRSSCRWCRLKLSPGDEPSLCEGENRVRKTDGKMSAVGIRAPCGRSSSREIGEKKL